MKSNTSDQYIPSLDGFRALSIAIVFIGHSFHNLPIPGGLGVTIFFFISGYLITTLLIREFEKTGTINFRAFYERRLLRLMPPLLITMLVGIVLVSLGWAEGSLDPMALISQVLFFYNYWDTHHSNDGVSGLGILWSLSVEEHFYLIFPVLFVASMKNNWNVRWLVLAAIAVLIWRTVKFLVLGANEWEIYALTDTRIDSIIWGCFLAVFLSQSSASNDRKMEKFRFFGFCIGVCIIVLTLIVRDDIFRSTVRYTLQGAALVPIFIYALNSRETIIFRILNLKPIMQIGVYSYTIYLVHYVLLNSINFLGIFKTNFSIAFLVAVLSILYAAVLNHFVELPIKRWRQQKQKLV